MADLLPLFVFVGLVASATAFWMWAADMIEPHEAVFWPIALLKFLLKSLWLVLFTGWKS